MEQNRLLCITMVCVQMCVCVRWGGGGGGGTTALFLKVFPDQLENLLSKPFQMPESLSFATNLAKKCSAW